MGVTVEDSFGTYFDEDLQKSVPIRRFTLTNKNGITVQIINYGAIITTINVPDKNGQFADINMGFDNIDGYTKSKIKPYFGAIVGRVANRIKQSQFQIDGQTFRVSANAGENHLHGGFRGFDKRVWDAEALPSGVTFSLVSQDGEEGYPGQVQIEATYTLTDYNELLLHMAARCTSTKPTPINLTNHAYFNLAGHDKGAEEIYKHRVTINADAYTPAVDTIPTGEIRKVDGTPFDLRQPRVLGDVFPQTPANGYDNNFCVNQTELKTDHDLYFVARAEHPDSGRVLEVFSNLPGVQFYTANFLPTDDALPGKGGALYKKHGAFCLETQGYPDSVNKPNFPNTILRPGEMYKHVTLFCFSAKK